MSIRLVIGPIFVCVFLYIAPIAYAENLLNNSSFEDGLTGWTKNVSTVTLTQSSQPLTGSASAALNKTNGSGGTIYLYQDVDIEPGSFYSLSGSIIKNSANFSWAIVRVSWRDSSTEISKTDSNQLTADVSTYQLAKIDAVQAPAEALNARIELVANITSPNPTNPILFDDISFEEIPPPEQPTASPTPTKPVTTNTPIPTATKTPTRTPTLLPSSQAPSYVSSNVNPKGPLSVDDDGEENSSSEDSVLAAETLITPSIPAKSTPSSEKAQLVASANTSPFGIFFLLIGILLISSCGILVFLWGKREQIW